MVCSGGPATVVEGTVVVVGAEDAELLDGVGGAGGVGADG